jgi:hypothetical protein
MGGFGGGALEQPRQLPGRRSEGRPLTVGVPSRPEPPGVP